MQPIGWKKMTTLGSLSNTTGVGDGRRFQHQGIGQERQVVEGDQGQV
jgi:hypothetical protein